MNGYEFERALVELFVEVSKGKGFKSKPLAVAAWPDRKDPGTKWRKIRNGKPPRELNVRDAYNLATALGISFTELCGAVQGKAFTKEISSQSLPVPEKNNQAPPKEIPENRPAHTDEDGAYNQH